MEKKWLVKSRIEKNQIDALRNELKVDEIVAELLLQRGVHSFDQAQEFFRPDLEKLHDPFLMKNMDEAVDRLNLSIENQEKVLLFGDYDVDGTTAVSLMYSFLKDTLPVDYYIPDRYQEGYGLSKKGIECAIENKVDLLITLDCGIRSVELIDFAKENGIDVIVCDHHEPGDVVPDCIVLDPKQIGCEYPYKELSGCGVGFKLLQGLCDLNSWSYDNLFDQLDFLALSIGADIVEVTGENRILAYHGLKRFNKKPRMAFKELLTLAKREFPVTLTDLIFTIAPRINAAGRLRSGRYAVQLMISDKFDEIHQLAEEINEDNLERRNIDASITEEALKLIEPDKKATVVYAENWHKGVVGIVASRLIENCYRPTIVLTLSNGFVTGSARSIEGFDVLGAITACDEYLEQYGGHKFAAGLSLKPENLEAFKKAFENEVEKRIESSILIPEQKIDLGIDFSQIFTAMEDRSKLPRLKRILNQFEPHGPGNMKPVFTTKNIYSRSVNLLKDAHLKISVVQSECDVCLEGIGFNMPEKVDTVAAGVPFDMAYTLEVNRWRGNETLQVNIKDLREHV